MTRMVGGIGLMGDGVGLLVWGRFTVDVVVDVNGLVVFVRLGCAYAKIWADIKHGANPWLTSGWCDPGVGAFPEVSCPMAGGWE